MSTAAHVLIVEDEEHLAQGLKFNLEAEGYRASIAGDGETALEIAGAPDAAIDVILLDVMLPGCDGFSVVEQLRERDDRTPVLMLTARGRPEDVLRGFAAGADDYLPKPFDLSILLARLHSLLRRWAWQRRESDAVAPGRPKRPTPLPDAPSTSLRSSCVSLTPTTKRAAAAFASPSWKPSCCVIWYATRDATSTQGAAGTGMAHARGHGHPRHRQLHRAFAPPYRG